jgi:hypothetical protein
MLVVAQPKSPQAFFTDSFAHISMGILVIDITISVDGFDSLLQRVASNKGECLIARFVLTIRLVGRRGTGYYILNY